MVHLRLILLFTLFVCSVCAEFTKIQYYRQFESNRYNFLCQFARKLHDIEHFRSLVIFTDVHENHHYSWHSLNRQLVTKLELPLINWGKNEKIKFNAIINIRSLIVVRLSTWNASILQVVDKTLEELHVLPILYILERKENSSFLTKQELLKFFHWCWQKKMINALVIYQHQIYTFTPFPQLTIRNLTNTEFTHKRSYVNTAVQNVQGYRFNVPVYQGPPRVVLIPSKPSEFYGNESLRLSGIFGIFFENFFRSLNGTIQLEILPNVTFYTYHNVTLLKKLQRKSDIGIYPVTPMKENRENMKLPHFFDVTRACVVVPYNHLPPEYYIEHLATKSVGIFHLCIFLALIAINSLSCGQWMLKQTFFQCIAATTLQAAFDFKKFHLPYKVFYVTFMLYMVLMCSMISAKMTTAFTSGIRTKQIETIEDFLASNFTIMTNEYDRLMYFENGLLPAALIPSLYITEPETSLYHINTLNSSYAYIVGEVYWSLLIMRQRSLKQPLFRIVGDELCTPNFSLQFLMQPESPFASQLYKFFTFAIEHGLKELWELNSFHDALKNKIIFLFPDETKPFKPLGNDIFLEGYKDTALLYALSFVCFLGELAIFYLRKLNAFTLKIK